MDDAHFTEATTACWQTPTAAADDEAPPWRWRYPAVLPDGRRLLLPIRRLAAAAARGLGHARHVPLGTSRKFRYGDALSVPVQSITSPRPGKRLDLDPRQRALLEGRRVLIVDDAVSSGSTLGAAWDLLESLGAQVAGAQVAGAQVAGAGVAMRQGTRWHARLGPARTARVVGVFDSPLLQAVADGWVERR